MDRLREKFAGDAEALKAIDELAVKQEVPAAVVAASAEQIDDVNAPPARFVTMRARYDAERGL